MNLLAFDTSTEHLSIALGRGAQVWSHAGPGGAQASGTLIPAIQALLAQGGLRLTDLQAIVFGAGPGSFTGLRTACAVAQGLGFGAGVPLLPVDTLLAVAEDARQRLAPGAPGQPCNVLVVLDARMDEVYAAAWCWDGAHWSPQGEAVACKPQALASRFPAAADPAGRWALAGNAFAVYGDRLLAGLPPGIPWMEAQPGAAALLRLAPALLAAGQAVPAAQAMPRYIRDKVAQTTDERAAAKAAALPPAPDRS
jgi:tRNA threonylcarbamoyladenosine biosynthesis protein TsaB